MVKSDLHILLIEDNPADVLFLHEALAQDARSDFHLTVVDSLHDALELLAAQRFDAALLDLNLPDSQGSSTFLNLHRAAPDLPVVVLSALEDEEVAKWAGAQDYLVKRALDFPVAGRVLRHAIERQETRSALHSSEQRFSNLFHSTPVPVGLMRASDYRIAEVNSAWENLTGYTSAEALGKTYGELGLARADTLQHELGALGARGESSQSEETLYTRTGDERTVLLSSEPIELDGQAHYLNTLLDITERKRAQDILRQSESRFRRIFEDNMIPMGIYAASGEILDANDALLALLGRTRAEMETGEIRWDEITPSEYRERDLHAVREIQQQGFCAPYEKEFCHRDGHPIPILIGGGEFDAHAETGVFYAIDLTKQKSAEGERRNSEQELRALVTSLDDIVFEVNEHGTYLNVWTANEAMLFAPRERVIGRRFDEVFGEQASRPFFEFLALTLDTGLPQTLEYPVDIGGAQHWFAARYSPIRGLEGTGRSVSILVRDITERKLAEARLRHNEALLAEAQRIGRIGHIEWMEGSSRLDCSDEFYRILGLAPDAEITKETLSSMLAPEERERLARLDREAFARRGSTDYVYRFRRGDGSERWLHQQGHFSYDERGAPIRMMAVCQDVTEQSLTEMALNQSRGHAQAMLDAIPDLMFRLDRQGVFLDYKAEAHDLHAQDQPSLIGLRNRDIAPVEFADLIEQKIDDTLSSGSLQTFEYQLSIPGRGAQDYEARMSPSGSDEVISIVRNITERRRAEALVYAQRDLARSIDTFDSLESGFPLMLDTILNVTGMDSGGIYLFHPGMERINLSYHHGLGEEFVRAVSSFPMNSDNVQALLSGKSSYFAGDDPALRNVAHQNEKLRALAVTPILSQNRVIGCLILASHTLNEIPSFTRPALETLAVEVGNVVLHLQSRASLRTSEENFRQITDTINEVFWIFDNQQGKMAYISPAYERIWGRTAARLYEDSRHFVEAILPEDRQIMFEALAKQEHGEQTAMEYRIVRPDGAIRWINDRSYPVFNGRGAVLRTTGIATDVTERKRAETLLNQRLEDLALINTLNRVVNRGGNLVAITELLASEAEKIFGTQAVSIYLLEPDRQCLVLQHFTMSREFVEKLEKLTGRALPQIDLPVGGDDHFSLVLNSEDGILISGYEGVCAWLRDFSNTSFLSNRVRPLFRKIIPAAARMLKIRSVVSFPLKAGDEVLGVVEFTTEDAFEESTVARLRTVRHQLAEVIIRQRAEQALRASNEQYRLLSEELEERVRRRTAEVQDLYDSAPAGYHALDTHGRIIEVNQTQLNWSGYTRDEMRGRSFGDFVTPQSRTLFEREFPQFKARGFFRDVEFEMLRKDGSTYPVLVNATAIYDAGGSFVQSRSTVFDNTERKMAEQAIRARETQLRLSRDKLSAANAALEKAARMKDEFLASMSHELRTPLTGILGMAELLQLTAYGPLTEKQEKAVQNIENSGRHLLDLINDILDLSKIEAGMLELNIEPVTLSDICQASLQLTRGMAYKKQQIVRFSMEPPAIRVRADALRLKQMLVNLLSNAIKFTANNGSLGLDVRADERAQLVWLTVWDKGIGIAPENLEQLFQPFVQLESSLSRQYEGTGLGLSLVQRMAELHGGSVEVESTPGEGSRFTIVLPWQPEGSQPARTSPASSVSLRKALVIEDSEFDAEQLTSYLHRLGLEVIVHETGKDAVERAAHEQPDVILLDLHLPDRSGLDVLMDLQAHPATHALPVICCSVEERRSQALALGAGGYLIKPLSLPELRDELSKVASALAQRRAEAQPPDVSRPMVLVVDDNEMVVEMICDFLAAQNFRVAAARSGTELLEIVSEIHPDTILMDIQMPVMDGMEATRRIRSHPDQRVSQAPIIALTGLAMTGDRERCLAAGANAYLSKPVNLMQLVKMVGELTNAAAPPLP